MTPITFHQASVLYSGSALVVASLFIFGVFQLGGPRYPDHWPLGPIRRAIIFFLGVMALIRGVTLFFPGEAVPVQHVSSLMPWWATAVLLASGMVPNWSVVTGSRAADAAAWPMVSTDQEYACELGGHVRLAAGRSAKRQPLRRASNRHRAPRWGPAAHRGPARLRPRPRDPAAGGLARRGGDAADLVLSDHAAQAA